MAKPRVWLDCETGGVDLGRRAWEVGLIRRAPGGDRSTDMEFSWFVDIADLDLPNTADPKALEVGGFWRRHPQAHQVPLTGRLAGVVPDLPASPPEAPVFRERTVMEAVAERTAGKAIIHGSNPAFDIYTLWPRMAMYGIEPDWYYSPVDVPHRAASWLTGAGLPVPVNEKGDEKSDLVAKACGVDPADYERHSALGDCRLFRDLFDVIRRPHPRLARLEERLAVAERVCSLFGATASRMDTDRDKALHELWRAWVDQYGDGVKRISDAEIAELARQRDDIRARTLAKIRGGETS